MKRLRFAHLLWAIFTPHVHTALDEPFSAVLYVMEFWQDTGSSTDKKFDTWGAFAFPYSLAHAMNSKLHILITLSQTWHPLLLREGGQYELSIFAASLTMKTPFAAWEGSLHLKSLLLLLGNPSSLVSFSLCGPSLYRAGLKEPS